MCHGGETFFYSLQETKAQQDQTRREEVLYSHLTKRWVYKNHKIEAYHKMRDTLGSGKVRDIKK